MHTFAFFQIKVKVEFHINHKKNKQYVQFMMKFLLYHVMKQLSKVMIQKSLFVIDRNLN